MALAKRMKFPCDGLRIVAGDDAAHCCAWGFGHNGLCMSLTQIANTVASDGFNVKSFKAYKINMDFCQFIQGKAVDAGVEVFEILHVILGRPNEGHALRFPSHHVFHHRFQAGLEAVVIFWKKLCANPTWSHLMGSMARHLPICLAPSCTNAKIPIEAMGPASFAPDVVIAAANARHRG